MDTAPAPRRERARPLAPEERREAIIAATRPLLLEHGRATTTRMVAEAAGVAEGTLFRVFDSKDDLFDAVVERELDLGPFLEAIEAVDLDQPLTDRLVQATEVLQQRLVTIFALMTAMAVPRPPATLSGPQRHELATRGLVRVVAPDAHLFRVPPAEVVRMIRLLTFSGSHPHIAAEQTLTPAEVVDVVLRGTLVDTGGRA